MASIRPVDSGIVNKICCGQVITDLSSAVKELIENSIDAQATSIEIKLMDMGLKSVEIIDNGTGISSDDYENVTLKHYTSKISSFEDINRVASLGFRGEALNALCELCENLIITTKTSCNVTGMKLSFNRDGSLKDKTPIARNQGTTVIFYNLYFWLPVRRMELTKSIKKQYQKILKMVQTYAIISNGVKFIVSNHSENGKTTVLVTEGTRLMSDNISCVFGSKFTSGLVPISLNIPIKSSSNKASVNDDIIESPSSMIDDGLESDSGPNNNDLYQSKTLDSSDDSDILIIIDGYVSNASNGIGRSDNDRQFVYLNNRPVDIPKIVRAVNEVWRRYELKSKPAFFLNVEVPSGCYDVNLTPDKREVVLAHETEVIEALKTKLDQLYAPSKYSYPITQILGSDIRQSFKSSQDNGSPNDVVLVGTITSVEKEKQQSIDRHSLNDSSSNDAKQSDDDQITFLSKAIVDESIINSIDSNNREISWVTEEESSMLSSPSHGQINSSFAVHTDNNNAIVHDSLEIIKNDSQYDTKARKRRRIEYANEDVPWMIDERFIRSQANHLEFNHQSTSDSINKDGVIDDSNAVNTELSMIQINKTDFLKMRIIGQFNLGFIIAELNGDLFILDQHACDEKYRFETLQKTTKIYQQPLVVPMTIETSISEEIIIKDNLNTFESNGFKIEYNDDDMIPSGKRLKLLAIPMSKNTEFGVKDIHELASLLGESMNSDAMSFDTLTVRNTEINRNSIILPKIMNMYASRACRSSVMIGTALKQYEMINIVKNLSTIEQPWNCPHGRPTMRHLANIRGLLVDGNNQSHYYVSDHGFFRYNADSL